MKTVEVDDIRQWLIDSGAMDQVTSGLGVEGTDPSYLAGGLGLPTHLVFAIEHLAARGEGVAPDAFDSLSFYSLCRGLFLPLSYLAPERAAFLFGLKIGPAPDTAGREALVEDFIDRELGLTLTERLGCLLGDPFIGRRSTFRRDSLLRLLISLTMVTRAELLDRLTHVGEVAALFAQSRPALMPPQPLTSAEVMRALYFIPDAPRRRKFEVLRSLLQRMGKLEAYFLARLLLRKAGFGFDYQGPLLARILARKHGADEAAVGHALALTDVFRVAEVLDRDGAAGLRKIRLQPLVPVKPMLAGGITADIKEYPTWVERKYDGIRLLVHKSTDSRGSVLCGAYTRTGGDWLELIAGLDVSIRMLPARAAIVDGELYGTVFDLEGTRPATVYEVYAALQGKPSISVNLRLALFDVIFLEGQDLTAMPLMQRRQILQGLIGPLAPYASQMPVPFQLAEGQLAQSKDDVNRLYQHFRAQGYEGVIAKVPNGPYKLATRDPDWTKRKPQITIDLVLLGATFAVTTKERAGMFGSYVIGARNSEGGFVDVGDVAGVDRVRDAEIQQMILRDGLITGERIERPSASGRRPGIALRPSIVVTLKFEGIVHSRADGTLKLRDPKVAVLRPDKSASQADHVDLLEEIYLRMRVG